jgi:hypothetical protein
MVRIQFPTGRDRVRGKYVLVTQSVVQRPRGPILKVSKAALKLLDERQFPYRILGLNPRKTQHKSSRGWTILRLQPSPCHNVMPITISPGFSP